MLRILSIFILSMVASVAYAADVTIIQSHTTFDSDEVKIKKGDTLVFLNKDDVTHNIQITNSEGDNDDKGLQKPGETIRSVLSDSGDYKVHCAIHPKMKLKVTVQ